MAKRYRLGMARRLVNRLMTHQIRRGRGPEDDQILTTIGRRSGLVRSTPITLITDGQERWIVAPYGAVGWVHNIRATGKARLERGGKVEDITVTELSPDAGAHVLAEYHARLRRIVGPYMDVPRRGATEDDFKAIATAHPVFEIDRA